MPKIAVLFAGQGAQKTGMGKSLYKNSSAAKEIYNAAEQVMPGIKSLCFEGEQAELDKTENTQPCVFVTDMAAYAAFTEIGLVADGGAGFSLGEYAALVAAGVIPFKQALQLVIKRAGWMQEAAAKNAGGMVAIIGKTADETESIAEAANDNGLLLPVNYNCPGQTVIAGDTQQLKNLRVYCKEHKIRCIPLPVSGAFHTQQMSSAAKKIAKAIEPMSFAEPTFELYANKTARPYKLGNTKEILAQQTCSPVLFEQIIRHMLEAGYDTFIELGPGKTLTGFVKRIQKKVDVYNIDSSDTLEQVKQTCC